MTDAETKAAREAASKRLDAARKRFETIMSDGETSAEDALNKLSPGDRALLLPELGYTQADIDKAKAIQGPRTRLD